MTTSTVAAAQQQRPERAAAAAANAAIAASAPDTGEPAPKAPTKKISAAQKVAVRELLEPKLAEWGSHWPNATPPEILAQLQVIGITLKQAQAQWAALKKARLQPAGEEGTEHETPPRERYAALILEIIEFGELFFSGTSQLAMHDLLAARPHVAGLLKLVQRAPPASFFCVPPSTGPATQRWRQRRSDDIGYGGGGVRRRTVAEASFVYCVCTRTRAWGGSNCGARGGVVVVIIAVGDGRRSAEARVGAGVA